MPKPKSPRNNRKLDKGIIVALIGLVGTITAAIIVIIPFLLADNLAGKSTTLPSDINMAPNSETETPFPYGPTLLEMDFTEVGNGYCDKYDATILGYEFHKYYIRPLDSRGYISACRSGEWGPKVSLEVEAYPEGDLSFFGYAVIIGWQGNSSGTTDACMFGVKRTSGSQTVSEAFVKQRIDGEEKTLSRITLPFPLDNKPHKIRVVFLTDSSAIGYIDNQFIDEFEFDHCSKGKIGLVGWGTGETKIYFDNFRLNSLP